MKAFGCDGRYVKVIHIFRKTLGDLSANRKNRCWMESICRLDRFIAVAFQVKYLPLGLTFKEKSRAFDCGILVLDQD